MTGTRVSWAARTPPGGRPRPPPGPTESHAGYDHLVEVGRGGDSVGYRARDVAMDRDVAIKVLQTDDERAVARFRREIAITVRLGRQHPHRGNAIAVVRRSASMSGTAWWGERPNSSVSPSRGSRWGAAQRHPEHGAITRQANHAARHAETDECTIVHSLAILPP